MMHWGRGAGAAIVGLALRVLVAHAQVVDVLPFREGDASFHIRATIVNDFTGHAAIARAAYTGADLAHVQGFVEVRVADMRTGIGLRDRHLRSAMRADSVPLLRFDVARVESGAARGDTVPVVFVGRLAIRGVTREVRAPGSVVVGRGTVEVRTEFPIDMRDYGVTPPVKMFGALRVAPDVAVGIHLVFGQAAVAP